MMQMMPRCSYLERLPKAGDVVLEDMRQPFNN